MIFDLRLISSEMQSYITYSWHISVFYFTQMTIKSAEKCHFLQSFDYLSIFILFLLILDLLNLKTLKKHFFEITIYGFIVML